MENILLLGVLLLIFIIGYLSVKKVDTFLEEVKKTNLQEYEPKEPTYIVISGDRPLMEIDAEIEEYRKKHKHIKVILCEEDENTDLELS